MVFLGIISLIIYSVFFDDSIKKYSLEHLHYDVEILPDGDALVNEKRLYSFKKGEFTRGYFQLEDGIEDIKVYENGRAFNLIQNFDKNRPEGSYAYKKDDGLIRLEWYIRAKGGQEHTYNITYRVKNVATLYNDCAVYFQKFLSQKNTTKIKKLTASVQLPPGANSNNTLIWGHGPSSGNLEFDKNDDNKVNLSIKNVPIKNYVEARFLLDKELMSNVKYIENKDMRDHIINEETIAAKKADKERMIIGISSLLAYILGAVLIILPIFLRIKKKYHFTKYTPEIEPEYYRDIPQNIEPAILDKLYNFYGKGENISKQVSGTVMDLIQRKVISVSHEQKGRKRETYLRVTENYKDENMADHEKILMNFFFKDIGQNRGYVSIKEIKKYCKGKSNINNMARILDSFSRKIYGLWSKYKYEEHLKNNVPNVFAFLKIIALVFVIGSFSLYTTNKFPMLSGAFLILIIAGSISFVINIMISREKKMLNQRGENQLALWKGFYKFLNDFTLFEEKELPELFMWERYLVYATVLGISKRVLKQLKVRYPQLNDPDFVRNNMLFLSNFTMMDEDMVSGLMDMNTSIENAFRDAQNVISNLSSSSSSGSGGGFSSGGSSGGSGAGGSTGGGMD